MKLVLFLFFASWLLDIGLTRNLNLNEFHAQVILGPNLNPYQPRRNPRPMWNNPGPRRNPRPMWNNPRQPMWNPQRQPGPYYPDPLGQPCTTAWDCIHRSNLVCVKVRFVDEFTMLQPYFIYLYKYKVSDLPQKVQKSVFSFE